MPCLPALGTRVAAKHIERLGCGVSAAPAHSSTALGSKDCHAFTATAPSRNRGGHASTSARQHAAPSQQCDSPSDCAQPSTPVWRRLEALYASDHFPVLASSPWRAGLPSAGEYSALHQLLRPVGGLLHLAVQLEEKPRSPAAAKEEEEERRKRQAYYANVGDAIRTLREEIPLLFVQELTYDIYRDDVVFKDPRNTLHGKKNYRRLFRGLRIFGRLFFTRCHVEVRRIWQPEPNRISMRWQFHGVPRIPWEVEGIFDGVSQFKLDKEGKIFEHRVDNVVLRDPPLGVSTLWTSLSRIFNPQPQPCPGINFDDSAEGPLALPAPLASQRQWQALERAMLQQKHQQRTDLLLE